jgi:hypothetical protein
MATYNHSGPVRLIPFPPERDLGNGWYRREWHVRGGDLVTFEPPSAGSLNVGAVIVTIVPVGDDLTLRLDTSRSDEPHDLAYASLVLQRLVRGNRDGCEIDGHRRNRILNLATED